MDYHQNARLTIHSREQLAKMVVEQGGTLKAAADAFNVSAKTAAKWVRRYREHGQAGLKDFSSRPHRSPRQTSTFLLERVLLLRRQRWNGWRMPTPSARSAFLAVTRSGQCARRGCAGRGSHRRRVAASARVLPAAQRKAARRYAGAASVVSRDDLHASPATERVHERDHAAAERAHGAAATR